MRTYYFKCEECKSPQTSECPARYDPVVPCTNCGHEIHRIVQTAPKGITGTTTGLMQGSDDGFGTDNKGRMIARAKARAAGIDIAGAKFHPGLCRRGVMFDPQAWYRDPAEVHKKADKLGRNVDGIITHHTPVRDEWYKRAEEPYQCAPDLVENEVKAECAAKYGKHPTPAQKAKVVEKHVAKHSGNLKPLST